MSPPTSTTDAVQVRRAADRFVTRTESATTRHSFSFGDHYDPVNVSWGPLVAHNVEELEAGGGYAPHRHAGVDIVTWVLSGTLAHEDGFDHVEVVRPGSVQSLGAGAGVEHAERNADPAPGGPPVRFVQMWVRADHPAGSPRYTRAEVPVAELEADWVRVAAGSGPPGLLPLDCAGATLWAGRIPAGQRRDLQLRTLGHLFVASGTVEVDGIGPLLAGDSLRLRGDATLAIRAATDAELLGWELAG